jgi:hypothetical protein
MRNWSEEFKKILRYHPNNVNNTKPDLRFDGIIYFFQSKNATQFYSCYQLEF